MTDDPLSSETPVLSGAAAAEWLRHVEAILRGVAHALNNRAAALAALLELTTEPAEEAPVLREIIGTEQHRIRDLVRVIRLIGAASNQAEAVLPDDVVREVAIVLGQHPELRDGAVQIDAVDASPVRVMRSYLARALVSLAAGLSGATRASPGRIVATTEGDWLVIGSPDAGTITTPPLATELAAAMGGEALENRYGIRVPTLAAIRRREGR